jgi:hypothetical protein
MKTALGLSIPQTLEEVCDPQRVALLVYDMQVGILSQIKNAEQIKRRVLKVLSTAMIGVAIAFLAPWIIALVGAIWIMKRIKRAPR